MLLSECLHGLTVGYPQSLPNQTLTKILGSFVYRGNYEGNYKKFKNCHMENSSGQSPLVLDVTPDEF